MIKKRGKRRIRQHAVTTLALALLAVPAIINICNSRGVMQRSLASIFYHPVHPRTDGDVDGQGGMRNQSDDKRDFNEHALQLYMHRKRMALINESNVLNHQSVYHHFDDDMEMTIREAPWLVGVGAYCAYDNSSTKEEFLKIFTEPDKGDILSGQHWGVVCCALSGFLETGGGKRHVLMHPFDSNWGEFSDYVPGRTCNWGGHADCDGKIWEYLNHTNLSAVFTAQHQWFDHPKVHSVPLGPAGSHVAGALHAHPNMNRTVLLFLSNSDYEHRVNITRRVISNFNGTISNRYHDGSDYLELLRTSKFVLCPSGLGWDTYRAWEALVLGAIPILETYYRRDGFYRAFADLPVLWVDHFDNVTPEMLEREYPRILLGAKEYVFEKLTNQWWIDLINSYRFVRK